MQFTFIDAAGKTLFLRDDAEQAQWTVEEMTLNMDFPYIAGKAITTGQRILFRDPMTNGVQIYEVKTAKTLQPDGLQQITAENICISELSDVHMEKQELTDTSCQTAINGVLSGSGWQLGELSVNPVSSGDLSRGSVWQAVLEIKTNWNVYIEPRLTIDSSGNIGRYLDVKSTDGEWHGVRLSIDKNFVNPAVTIDDTEVETALYGYGGTVNEVGSSTEVTFENVVWQRTDDHPAKPAGQKYIEWPAATESYGRNGRPRYGYYQNTDITDPETLLEKTWEALKNCAVPDISIEGTVEDLRRMGYADEPIRLHDIALVEIRPTGFVKQLQIIKMSVNLLDASDIVVTIGAYIPNIIYIERQTNMTATGSRGGGGGNKSEETTWQEFRTTIQAHADRTGLEIKAVQNDIEHQEEEIAVQTGRIDVAYNKITAEVIDRRQADNVLAGRIQVNADNITAEVSNRRDADNALSGRIEVNSNKVALVVDERAGGYVIKSASIVASINNSGSQVAISADHVTITGDVKLSGCMDIQDGNLRITRALLISGTTSNVTINNGTINSKSYQVNSGGGIKFVGSETGEYYDLDATTLKGMVKSFAVSGNVLTLTPFYGDPVTFSKATTLTGVWSGGVYTVTASPQGNTKTVGFSQSADSPISLATNGTPTSVTTNKKLVSAPLRVIETIGTSQTDVYTTNLTINATAAWDEGWKAAAGEIVYPSAAPSGTEVLSFDITLPDATPGNSSAHTFTLAKGATPAASGYASVSLSGTVVGRIDIGDWYSAGYEVTRSQIADSNFTKDYTGSTQSTWKQIGSFSKASITANSYIYFDITVHGTTRRFYIVVNQ